MVVFRKIIAVLGLVSIFLIVVAFIAGLFVMLGGASFYEAFTAILKLLSAFAAAVVSVGLLGVAWSWCIHVLFGEEAA